MKKLSMTLSKMYHNNVVVSYHESNNVYKVNLKKVVCFRS